MSLTVDGFENMIVDPLWLERLWLISKYIIYSATHTMHIICIVLYKL